MKTIFCILVLLLSFESFILAQKEEILSVAEQMPVFGICEGTDGLEKCSNKNLFSYIANNLKYPEAARKAGVEGMVVVSFVVDPSGKVINSEIRKSLSKDCDEESLRVIREMPDWLAGKQNGRAVSVRHNLPVRFKLNRGTVEKEEVKEKKNKR